MNKKGICPVCHSDNINYGDLDVAEDDKVFYHCECNECHSIWDEVYTLQYVDVENIEEESNEG